MCDRCTVLRITLIVAILCLGFATLTQADTRADGINDTATPQSGIVWCNGCTALGWYYVPSFSYSLSGIQTNFNPFFGANRDVTVEVLTDRRFVGGSLIKAATFNSASARGTLGGVTFSPAIPLTAGTRYFVGLRNVQGIGINTTTDAGAFNLGPIGLHLDNDGVHDGQYELRGGFPCQGSPQDQPILRFLRPTSSTAPTADRLSHPLATASSLSLSRGILLSRPNPNTDIVRLQGSFSAAVTSINPPTEGVAIGLVDGEGVVTCIDALPGTAKTEPGPKWSFQGDAGEVNVAFNAGTGEFDVTVKVSGAELVGPDGGFISTVVTIGGFDLQGHAEEFMNTQEWKSQLGRKLLITP